MNIEYVRGLRDYFKEIDPDNIQPKKSTLRVRAGIPTSEISAWGSFGVHSAVFNDAKYIDRSLDQKVFNFADGMESNTRNGLCIETITTAYWRCGGKRHHFHPYSASRWEVPVLDVLDEVIRMHEEKAKEE